MRYRKITDLKDFSRDVAEVISFIGEAEYRSSLEELKKSLNLKGFVTPFEDSWFALELDLYNLEKLRTQFSGDFKLLPRQCHEGWSFLIGLGQTIPILTPKAKARLLGQIRGGLKEGLWSLQHELAVAANLSKRGWDIHFHDLEEDGGFDFLVSKENLKCEVECKAISTFAGYPIKPENVQKLWVEIRQHFECDYGDKIPVLGLYLDEHLPVDRTLLEQVVDALSKVAQSRQSVSMPGMQARFIGTVPDMTPDKLHAAVGGYARIARKIVLLNNKPPKLVLELDSDLPIQLGKKIIRTIKDSADNQFSGINPAVIWTHIKFITTEGFSQLSSARAGVPCFLDGIADSVLGSEKRKHLNQLVFTGGSFLDASGETQFTSYGVAVYNSPNCHLASDFIFPGGRTRSTGGHRGEDGPSTIEKTPTVSEAVVAQKKVLCDTLIKQGIVDCEIAEAVFRTLSVTDLALELDHKEGISQALEWYESVERMGVSDEDAILLDFGRANAFGGQRAKTRWEWDQPTLARELYYLRRAISNQKFPQLPDPIRCECLNNLGNRLDVAGRVLEALDCWRQVLEIKSRFGMSLCNRARALVHYAFALDDLDRRAALLWMAHRDASAALAAKAVYRDRKDKINREEMKGLKKWIGSVLDVKAINLEDLLSEQDTSTTDPDREYRKWCLFNYLVLDPLNDLGPHSLAAYDSIELPVHVEIGGAQPRIASRFDEIKQEYISARSLLLEASTLKGSDFSNSDKSHDGAFSSPSLSPYFEKLKAAFGLSCSLFEKVGFFINDYLSLGIPDSDVSFRTLWRVGTQEPIRKEFDVTDNWGFCALFWLAKDLSTEEKNEPVAHEDRGRTDLGDFIEPGCLRDSTSTSPPAPLDGARSTAPHSDFEDTVMHTMKLARAAIIYLTIGVYFEEERRKRCDTGTPTPAVHPHSESLNSEDT